MKILRLMVLVFMLGVTLPARLQTYCQEPPDDYTRLQVTPFAVLSQRTLSMLEHAQDLYGGIIDLTQTAITQGSYNEGGIALSFGTHDGGGAVDISVRNIPRDWTILWDEISKVIEALRKAGFAAWYRDESDGMTPHIHAIAIGDAELSYAASLQLTGRYGYFRGFDGLPQADGVPQADEDGDLFVCDWMIEAGYQDLRSETPPPIPPYDFQIGDSVVVNVAWGGELNLRAQPTLAAAIVARMPHETLVRVLEGPHLADDLRWWYVETAEGDLGWAVEAVDGTLTLVP